MSILEECVLDLELSLAEDWESAHWDRAAGGKLPMENERETLHRYHSDQADKHREAAQKHAHTELFPRRPSDRKGPAEWKSASSERKGKRHLKLVRAHQRIADKTAPYED